MRRGRRGRDIVGGPELIQQIKESECTTGRQEERVGKERKKENKKERKKEKKKREKEMREEKENTTPKVCACLAESASWLQYVHLHTT